LAQTGREIWYVRLSVSPSEKFGGKSTFVREAICLIRRMIE
jgi:hypothetical protein